MRTILKYYKHGIHALNRYHDFKYFELSIWLHTIAKSMISVFIPILLLEQGYSLREIILFYLLFNIFDIPLNFLADASVRKIGAKKVIILATISSILFYLLIGYFVKKNWLLLIILAMLSAIYDTFYWVSHIYLFYESSKDIEEKEGDSGAPVGILLSTRTLAYLVAPIIGAVMLIFFSKTLLAFLSILILIISLLPLYKMIHKRDLPLTGRITFKKYFSEEIEVKNTLRSAFYGVHNEIEDTFLALYVYFIFRNISSVAALPVIVAICSIIFSFIVGKLNKKIGRIMMVYGSLMISILWLVRITYTNPYFFYISVFFVALISIFINIPIEADIATRSYKTETLTTSLYRNASSMFLRIPLYLILYFSANIFTNAFLLASLSLLIMLITTIEDNKGTHQYI